MEVWVSRTGTKHKRLLIFIPSKSLAMDEERSAGSASLYTRPTHEKRTKVLVPFFCNNNSKEKEKKGR